MLKRRVPPPLVKLHGHGTRGSIRGHKRPGVRPSVGCNGWPDASQWEAADRHTELRDQTGHQSQMSGLRYRPEERPDGGDGPWSGCSDLPCMLDAISRDWTDRSMTAWQMLQEMALHPLRRFAKVVDFSHFAPQRACPPGQGCGAVMMLLSRGSKAKVSSRPEAGSMCRLRRSVCVRRAASWCANVLMCSCVAVGKIHTHVGAMWCRGSDDIDGYYQVQMHSVVGAGPSSRSSRSCARRAVDSNPTRNRNPNSSSPSSRCLCCPTPQSPPLRRVARMSHLFVQGRAFRLPRRPRVPVNVNVAVRTLGSSLSNRNRNSHIRTHANLSTHSVAQLSRPAGLESSALPVPQPHQSLTLNGFVRSVRKQKRVAFAAIGDGSSLRTVQAVLTPDQADA